MNYLQIPPEYVDYLNGVEWSPNLEAVDWRGGTFAMTQELAAFLEGFVSGGKLIHFGYVLHLFKLMGLAKIFDAEHLHQEHKVAVRKMDFDKAGALREHADVLKEITHTVDVSLRFREIFRQTGRSLRNVGTFAAQLCQDVPALAERPQLGRGDPAKNQTSVMSLLHAASEVWLHGPDAEALPWKPAAFEAYVRGALEPYTFAEVEHWFRHGRGPVKDGAKLAQELEAVKPKTLLGVLGQLAQRPRLAPAIPFVAQLVSALSLPPRKLQPNELPLGGYADVTNRGAPEHLLLSQFAVDDWEFVRRFAANELLYFRREEPPVQHREELVVLLDQGVRTWGDVRLVLSAAVFALGRRAAAAKLSLKLAATGNEGEFVDPLKDDEETLGTLLDRSDLSANPALALERVLEQPADGPRDVVLLTHPRSLAEPDVSAAARTVPEGTRLFAIGVDDQGQAQLAELRHGSPVTLARFRVDLSQKVEPPPVPIENTSGWTGDVEPVGFPFRFGLVGRIQAFALDAAGEVLLVASSNGILHAHRPTGPDEVLPRGWFKGELLRDVDAILGVPGGFVVAGHNQSALIAFHYHFPTRRVTAYSLRKWEPAPASWSYFPAFHSIVVHVGPTAHGVDLGTGEHAVSLRREETPQNRAHQACLEERKRLPAPQLVVNACKVRREYPASSVVVDSSASWPEEESDPIEVQHDAVTGIISVRRHGGDFRTYFPHSDGKPVLRGCQIAAAQGTRTVLALHVVDEKARTITLRLFRLPEGTPLVEFPKAGPLALLSQNGTRLARQVNSHLIAVHDLLAGGRLLSVTSKGQCHQNVSLLLGDGWMTLRVGDRTHLLHWAEEALRIMRIGSDAESTIQAALAGTSLHSPFEQARSGDPPQPWGQVWYDRKRFQSWAIARVVVAVDVFGQVAVYSLAQELVCMFFVFRDKVAGWMPDGTSFGPASVTSHAPTPQALERIGKALRRASVLGRLQTK